MLKIAILGPESTGKTQLAADLAQHFSTTFVDEYAREYLEGFTGRYVLDDVVRICKGQRKKVSEAEKENPKILITDTEAIVCKIWAEYVFGRVPKEIEEDLEAQDFDLYLLCSPDLPWAYDKLRENPDPNQRNELFEMYKKELESRNFKYEVVSGIGRQRSESAIAAIDRLMNGEPCH